ncbi:MAG TPA: pyridoxamine 5'-phosphate oxidase family protein [Gammaproteobacteria bacterium]|nr:pyridoxamine 5'-phosphate oxidase family protein [Gammaproteobacteria bacterium]
MAKFYETLTPELQRFIAAQKIFFVATAPLEGRINLSPKGMDTFRCLDERNVGYLDVTGSGNETAAHLEQNGRITIMFCSFGEQPLILKLYGRGRVIRPRDAAWREWRTRFPTLPGERQIILLELHSAQTSCGFGVPRVTGELRERDTLRSWAEKKGNAGIREYWERNNQTSIDGLPTRLLSDS